MAQTLGPNLFSQITVQGVLDLRFNGQTVSGEIDATSGGGLIPGQAVKMVDSLNGVPKFVECAAATDDVYGFINYNIKNQTFGVGDYVEVSAMRNNVMYMTASAAIARNAKVMIVVSGSKVATATTSNTIIGRAFDKAVNAGDLIRVTIDLPGIAD